MPSIASQMPVQFQNGAVWEEFRAECKGCGQTLPHELVRGLLARQTPRMASIEASGVCRECKLLTRFVYRLHDDMTITGPRNGRWLTWGGKPRGWVERLRSAIGF